MSIRFLPFTSSAVPRAATPEVEQLINAQTASAYDAARDFAPALTFRSADVQARLLEARAGALFDALGLEALLVQARASGLLDQDVVDALENAVDDAHEHAGALAEAIRATAPLTGSTRFERT